MISIRLLGRKELPHLNWHVQSRWLSITGLVNCGLPASRLTVRKLFEVVAPAIIAFRQSQQ